MAEINNIKGDVNRSTSPSVYDPRTRTFISKPVDKVCPHCGQLMVPDIKPIRNVMSSYMNPVTKISVVMNDDVNQVEVGGVTLYKVTGYDSTGLPVSSFIPAPAAPAAPKTTTPVVATPSK